MFTQVMSEKNNIYMKLPFSEKNKIYMTFSVVIIVQLVLMNFGHDFDPCPI